MARLNNGKGTAGNIKDWVGHAKENSFDQRQSKAQSKHDLDASNTKGSESDWSDYVGSAATPVRGTWVG
jgi:hypothetical protein